MRVVRANAEGSIAGSARGELPTAQDLERARHLCDRHREAGLREVHLIRFEARGWGKARGWLALESLQVTGSFKVRGALLAIERRLEAFRRRRGPSSDAPFVV